MKRRLKWIGIAVTAAVLGGASLITIEHIRGRVALDRYLSNVRSRGEELDFRKLEPRRPREDDNAYVALTELMSRPEAESVVTNLALPELQFASPGREIVVWRLGHWQNDDGKTTNDWRTVGLVLGRDKTLLDSVHAAVQRPAYDSRFDFRKGFIDPRFGEYWKVRKAAELLRAALYYELERDHLENASKHLRDLVKVAAEQQPEPLIVCQLVREHCESMAFEGTWQALQAPGWKDSDLVEIQSDWERFDLVKDMENAILMERALTIDFFAQLKDSTSKLTATADQLARAQEILGGEFGVLPVHGLVPKWIYLPVWRIAWIDQDELAAVERWQFVIDRERLARTNSWMALASRSGMDIDSMPWLRSPEGLMPKGWYDAWRFLFSSEIFSINDNIVRQALFAQVQQQMAITIISIYRYRLQNRTLPADLSALIPKYLSALPRDSMDGKTLHYKLRQDGSYMLYSVGEDGKDDGGDPSLTSDKERYRKIWDGRDAVWPTAAPDDEAAAAALKP
jgi:hypothetical protein